MLNVVSSEKERMETLFNEENLDCYQKIIKGTNLVLGPPEKFYRRNPSGTFRDVH